MQTLTDAELLEDYSSRQDKPFGVAQGEAAFGELMRRHGAMVYRACHRLLKDPHEAEDASQAVFVVLARKAGGLRRGDLAAWLYRVAHLVAAETVRKRMHREKREESYAVDEAIQTDAFAASDVADPGLLGLVDAALLSLPERYREAVILRYLQNHSEAEAAQRAGCAVGTLSMRASRGIERLRQRLTKRGVALGGVALVGLLTSEASAAVPETLLSSILATVKSVAATGAAATAATTKAAMLAKGAMKAMFWNSAKTAAMVAVSVGAIGIGGVAAVQAVAEKTAPKTVAAAATVTTATSAADVIAVLCRGDGPQAFRDLRRQGGPGVVFLGIRRIPVIPAELRFKPIACDKLIETLAVAHNFKILWARKDRLAVLFAGADDRDIESVRQDLLSSDTAVRRAAASRCGLMSDPRIVPPLVKAAHDAEAEVAHEAVSSLRKLG